ncbi:substrate-binding domain-containing protein [Rhodococcus sp. NPDC006774]|uniref:substrate-binding domain-containing protein n=1 Tax=Rhodococcus sp. NPDC006774 TaxID=3157186 RepID=UPI00340C4EEF
MNHPPVERTRGSTHSRLNRAGQSYRIGYIYPQSGPAGIYGPSCQSCGQLAVDRLNATDGIRSRPVELVPIDGGLTPPQVAHHVDTLITQGAIDAITGWHISAVRAEVARTTASRIPYVYAALHEGGTLSPHVVYAGESPAMQIGPALHWLHTEMGLQRWAIVGNDYIWPRNTAQYVHRYTRTNNLTITGEKYVPLGTDNYDTVVHELTTNPPDGVIMLLVGQDAVSFSRAFTNAGLTSDIARFSPIIEENVLLAADSNSNHNLYASAGYFDTLLTSQALDFATTYQNTYGDRSPRLNSIGESCYEAIMLLAALQTPPNDPPHDRVFESPRGRTTLTGNQINQDIYIAQADGLEFDVLDRINHPNLT